MLGVAWLLRLVQIVESKGLRGQSRGTLMVPMVREYTGWTNRHEQKHPGGGGVRGTSQDGGCEDIRSAGGKNPHRTGALYIKVEGHVLKQYWKPEVMQTADVSYSSRDQVSGSQLAS